MKQIVREQKDHHDTEYDLKYTVGEENIFHLFDFLQTQFQSDGKHQKDDPKLPDKIERIVCRTVEPKKGTHDRPRRDIADDMGDPEAL